MTGTLISLISIFIGILTANVFAYIKKQYSFGFTGNTLVGVFGSIFLIKSFGRLGFDPWSIMQNGTFHSSLFIINCLVSVLGAILGLIAVKFITRKLKYST
ncbi:hypothetical protein KO494_12925 [Lacinutrix sp. C3R15]|uniref:hypothetical protein n=1 Tax=Flavobacteriaceae TaxID=49546 RepID=UPI001C08FE05|nr:MULTISPECIES: hypothetical protein [Flavobacteriaceae]MBU2940443.1 hypothetical protein [Lacinutrix sp. C3R15]MDO6623763.1 hypothetical protein [Oceanihabitans sp. 1_MG-2023]